MNDKIHFLFGAPENTPKRNRTSKESRKAVSSPRVQRDIRSFEQNGSKVHRVIRHPDGSVEYVLTEAPGHQSDAQGQQQNPEDEALDQELAEWRAKHEQFEG